MSCFLPTCARPHRHGHGEAAGQQDDGVDAAQLQAQGVAAHGERGEVYVPVDGVGEHDAAEKHHFGDQEDPHPEIGRVLLLLESLKLSVQFSGAMHSALL